ncbi:MAG: ATP-binding cassette domain-containing protein, partial [Gammaproteobacteria bacterium]
DDVSLGVDSGEFVALLGPNGAGKTTLFQLLSGLFVADRGSISVLQSDIRTHAVTVLARLGIVFQQPTLDLDLTVRANLRFHARLHGMRGAMRAVRISEELKRLDILEHADKQCRGLSGGNRRKVELARALLHGPQLLLMDEATVGLDPASRRSLLDYVHELRDTRGMAVLWATHLVDEAERADKVVVLHRGRLIAEGAPSALIAQTGEPSLADAFLKLTGR